jgi:hypothetical protein
MSAKPAKKSVNPPASARLSPAAPAAAMPAPALGKAGAEATSWLESSDPRMRLWGKIILVAVWIYVGALCLLALDQTFHWGIFGPKVPLVP